MHAPTRPAVLALVPLAALISACVNVVDTEQDSLDGKGVSIIDADLDNGDVEVRGRRNTTRVDLSVTRWGRGSRRAAAEDRAQSVRWSATRDRDAILIESRSAFTRAGTDLVVDTPEVMDLRLRTRRGDVLLDEVEGVHSIQADRITGRVIGDGDFIADTSVNLDIVPFTATDLFIQAAGPVTIAVPFGLEYEITVRTDANDEVVVSDLGLREPVFAPGFFNGIAGRGDVDIRIEATGRVEILELR